MVGGVGFCWLMSFLWADKQTLVQVPNEEVQEGRKEEGRKTLSKLPISEYF